MVIVSGDGLIFEYYNGILQHTTSVQSKFLSLPVAALPGGSGNALCASFLCEAGEMVTPKGDMKAVMRSATYLLCKGVPHSIDLMYVETASKQKYVSFLSLAWGLLAEIDIESEVLRCCGPVRLTITFMMKLLRCGGLRGHRGRLSYLPSNVDCGGVTSDNGLLQHRCRHLRPLDEELDKDSGWVTYSERDFLIFVACNQSHVALGAQLFANARPDDGLIHMVIIREGVSRSQLITISNTLDDGSYVHQNCPYLEVSSDCSVDVLKQ